MDNQSQNEQDNDSKPKFKPGDKAKDYTATYEEYDLVVIVSVNEEEETAEVLPLESGNKGEIITRDLDKLDEYQPTVWMAMLPHAWGTGKSQYEAIINATAFFDADKYDEEVTLWTAEVGRDSWKIQHNGSIRSKVIKNEREAKVSPDLLNRISNVREDAHLLAEAALTEDEPAERYLREVKRR